MWSCAASRRSSAPLKVVNCDAGWMRSWFPDFSVRPTELLSNRGGVSHRNTGPEPSTKRPASVDVLGESIPVGGRWSGGDCIFPSGPCGLLSGRRRTLRRLRSSSDAHGGGGRFMIWSSGRSVPKEAGDRGRPGRGGLLGSSSYGPVSGMRDPAAAHASVSSVSEIEGPDPGRRLLPRGHGRDSRGRTEALCRRPCPVPSAIAP
jgi:hypothetical protein